MKQLLNVSLWFGRQKGSHIESHGKIKQKSQRIMYYSYFIPSDKMRERDFKKAYIYLNEDVDPQF